MVLEDLAQVGLQYPKGLSMDIYSYQVVGGNEGHDIQEINTLNHYIGMRTITRDELRDLDWIPFGLVAMALLALRTALLGNVRAMIDLSMVAAYISLIAFARFVWMLYEFGHDLDPKAPVKIAPFIPVVIGDKQVANFHTWSLPQLGSILLGVFIAGVWGLTLLYLWRGRREARIRFAPAIVYVTTMRGAEGVERIDVPAADNQPVLYSISATRSAAEPRGAAAFRALALGDVGQAILREHGFLPIGAK